MDATFLNILRGLNYDELTMAQASEVMAALREAVGKGEAWFEKFSAGFSNGATQNKKVVESLPAVQKAAPPKMPPRVNHGRGYLTPPVKRGRGRPRKVVPEGVRAGVEQGRLARPITSKSAGSTPAPATPVDDHPPIGVLQGSYVSTTGPDPNRAYSLPATHPRAGGAALPASGDADFAAVEAGKVRFQ